MGSRKGFKRGHYNKPGLEDLEVLTNKNAMEAQINTLRARIRICQSNMRGLRNRLRKGLNLKVMDEYQKLNQVLYRTKKAENVLVYHKNML
jgi:hypothetical protein